MAFKSNIDAFLAPIPGPNPSGEELRYTEVYDQIIEAKRADDDLARGEWDTELKRANWKLVVKLCTKALVKRSKDIQIAVWFTEALLHEHGFAGMQFGLELLTRLITDFWETVYPEIEDGDLDYRVGPLTYLNEKLNIPIFQVPLCDPKKSKGYNYFNWQETQIAMGGAAAAAGGSSSEEKVTAEDWKLAVNKGNIGYYKKLRDQLTLCENHIRNLDDLCSEKFADDPPGYNKMHDAIKQCLRVVDKIYTEKKKSEVVESEDGESLSDGTDGFGDMGSGDGDGNSKIGGGVSVFSKQGAITDISNEEKFLWRKVTGLAGNGELKSAFDQLMAAAALAPSERQKNRYLLLVAKLCINAGRFDLAQPIVEQLYNMIETLNLEKWEHPAWISEVIEALYRCIESTSNGPTDRAMQLFQKLCTLNITKAATYRLGGG